MIYSVGNTSFSIGFIFYYWDYYKDLEISNEIYKNQNDHSGYTQRELYIPIKYKSLKQEVLHNNLTTLDPQEYDICHAKAQSYMQSNIVKTRTIKSWVAQELKYNIPFGSKISESHILALILYCDITNLSTTFSSTFRRKHPLETLDEIKNRNREYAIWSKLLRECVQCFGCEGWRYGSLPEQNKSKGYIKGPFFCGMSSRINIPEYNIRLCGPTSTSKHISVATRFAGKDGIIIQMDNNGYWLSMRIRCFDCCWLSNYSEEDEYLFMGGDRRIKVENIRDIKTTQNFGFFIKPMFFLDCMVNGTDMDSSNRPKISERDKKILENLIAWKLRKIDKIEYPQYIIDSFIAFCNHKQRLMINLRWMELFWEKLTHLFLFKTSKINDYRNMKMTIKYMNYGLLKSIGEEECAKVSEDMKFDETNLPKLNVLLGLFPNLKEIIIYTTNIDGMKEYKLNVMSLWRVINECGELINDGFKINIKATQ